MEVVDLEFLGQASFALRVGAHEIVSDPWLVGAGQLGAWHAYPPRTEPEIALQRARVDRATHIYVSHDHTDHFDRELLAQLAPKILVTARFHNAKLRAALHGLSREAGHTLVELAPGETLTFGEGSTLRVIAEQPRFRTNSMLLVNTPLGAFLNANDCGLNSAVLAAIAKRNQVRLFFYTLNFMANGYPFPYLTSDDPSLVTRLDAIRDQIVESFRLAMQSLRPDLSIAFAGPVTYPDRCNAHLNRHAEALDWQYMIDDLSAVGRIAWPAPGARLTVTRGDIVLEQERTWSELLFAHPAPAATRVGPHETLDRGQLESAAHDFIERVGSAVARSRQKIGLSIYLSAVESREALESGPTLGILRLNLDEPRSLEWVSEVQPPNLQIISTPSILIGFLRGALTLDELLLSAYARFARAPDVFHGVLHNFLRFGHDAEATQELLRWLDERGQSRATFERVIDGKRHTLPRFCPHEGESLENATIENGKLVCPRHKWCFEIDGGACIAVGDPSINLYEHTRVPTDRVVTPV